MDLNIYCDESTHLPNDGKPYMVLGAVTCPVSETSDISRHIAEIGKRHGLDRNFEIKWGKVSPAKLAFYLDLVDYFFDADNLAFRAVVAEKAGLDHTAFHQSHDDWYYKMMFYLIRNVLPADGRAYIYIDKKDTRGGDKVRRLHSVIANANYDFRRENIRRVQIVDSKDVKQMQIADLILGAINYVNRGLEKSEAKMRLIERIQLRSGLSLRNGTLPSAQKMNLFFWKPQVIQQQCA
ncbi:DUF3800 domain-containing protein [Actinobaculum suis]|uniref:DUF3800 domain-containing protein n=1 Tax=Actinobaculum suis TaxID=1657 RepID=UPI00066FDAE3|nr:DUF3800 domain-containing protein [Actinobaculum suis]KMY22754.1 hypothetical protein ACU19_08210 [Actinobaculum suis]OCA94561.1 hypothetical protein ACU20_06280 [Actinobaculum suis]OCA94807.1 hypothetical protein ACU21_05640 [Actinobaculum suis]